MKIVLEGTIESISSRSDGSIKLVFGTQEMAAKQAGELFQMRGKYSKALLSDDNITPAEEELIQESSIQDGKKIRTKSARLRAILFVVWNNSADLKQKMEFEKFYSDEMERLISYFKKKLEPENNK